MKITDAKTGAVFMENGQPYQVLKYTHTKMGRGTANVRLKVKNLITGVISEKTYMNDSTLEDTNVVKGNAQYLYHDQNLAYFMNPSTYEQFSIDLNTIKEQFQYLKEGTTVQITYFEDRPITVTLPIKEKYKVTYTEPGEKGDTTGKTLKPATIETGAKVMVPLFINTGDTISVNTESGEYVGKG